MKVSLKLSVMVPIHGAITVEADSVEQALDQLADDAQKNGWNCRAWQDGQFKWSGTCFQNAEQLYIEATPDPSGDFLHDSVCLLEN